MDPVLAFGCFFLLVVVFVQLWVGGNRAQSARASEAAMKSKYEDLVLEVKGAVDYAQGMENERNQVVTEYNRLCKQYRELGSAMENLMAEYRRVRDAEPALSPLARDRKFWRSMVQMSHPDKAVSLDVARTMLNRVCQMAAKEMK